MLYLVPDAFRLTSLSLLIAIPRSLFHQWKPSFLFLSSFFFAFHTFFIAWISKPELSYRLCFILFCSYLSFHSLTLRMPYDSSTQFLVLQKSFCRVASLLFNARLQSARKFPGQLS
ncbi:hypothetical protein F5890DRAFT_497262 [Lentinula detonsa]|uniref:Uncharacterized protein n=1 Tax=Lentinula detonsa TaxID=2804962 RepID=A0AA38UXF2_9AGAR|nr:hypothetical protein F5890DRAFT_497262 [Lentinula detonsa]